MADKTFCPATMCPLFAPEGSIWTGMANVPCEGSGCGWHRDGRCASGRVATGEVAEATAGFRPWPRLRGRVRPRAFACPRAGECVWQGEAPGGLCAPRRALAHGLDPRGCL